MHVGDLVEVNTESHVGRRGRLLRTGLDFQKAVKLWDVELEGVSDELTGQPLVVTCSQSHMRPVGERPLALFDMDGTLFDYAGKLLADLEAMRSPGETPLTAKDLHGEESWLRRRIETIKNQPDWWSSLPLLPLGLEVYRCVVSTGYAVEVLTKGPKNRRAWAEKAQCIDDHFGDVPINIVGEGKGRYYGRLLCDDYVTFMEDWLEHRPRGLGVLIANEGNEWYEHPNVVRFDGSNYEEMIRAVDAAFRRDSGSHWRDFLSE